MPRHSLSAMQMLKSYVCLKAKHEGLDYHVTNVQIEVDLPSWAERVYKVYHTPGTYARKWRLLKAAGGFIYGVYDIAISHPAHLPEGDFLITVTASKRHPT